MLNGQKLQGPATSTEVYHILQQKGLVDKSVATSSSIAFLSLNLWLCFSVHIEGCFLFPTSNFSFL